MKTTEQINNELAGTILQLTITQEFLLDCTRKQEVRLGDEIFYLEDEDRQYFRDMLEQITYLRRIYSTEANAMRALSTPLFDSSVVVHPLSLLRAVHNHGKI